MNRTRRIGTFLLGLALALGLAWFCPVFARSPGWATARLPLLPASQIDAVRGRSTSSPLPVPPPLVPGLQAVVPASTADFDQAVQGMQRLDGLLTLYRDRAKGKLYAEIKSNQLNTNYLCTITLESGIGERGIYSGLPLADYLFNFRRVDQKIQFVVPNVYFRTLPNDPLRTSVQRSFSSSVLQMLPIRAYHPKRQSYLVDLSVLFLGDFPGLTPILELFLGSSYTLDPNKTHFGLAKAFPLNVELESIYGFSGSNPNELPVFLETVPDSRSFNLRVRYSLSQLPVNNGYRPRLADNRVGYFITAYQNLSDDSPRSPFVRYINRWHLEKQDPAAALSPPKKPIVFWLENTIPVEYRQAVREGVLLWNKAFEAAGFQNAIQVQQMPKNASWDPADIRYNTIRWFTSFDDAFLGMGPARVNPLTGEILDTDILIDANFARYLKQQYHSLVPQRQARGISGLAKLAGNPDICSYGMVPQQRQQAVPAGLNPRLTLQLLGQYDLCFGLEATHQLAMGAMSLATVQGVPANSPAMKEYIQSFLRMLIAHEVGHTLGLRHNFRASAMLSPAELNNPTITRQKGLVASVMDYSAINLAPPNSPQGDYFTPVVGPYDEWAIAYGYTPTDGRSPQAQQQVLEAILRRAVEPDLAYATDEDTFARLDPLINRFDMSSDLLTYAPWQLENAQQMWQRLDQRHPPLGDSLSDLRLMFDEIFNYYFQYARFLTRYVGGQSFTRSQSSSVGPISPFTPIPPAQQRQALALLQKYVFDDRVFRFSPALLNKLAPSRWNHWGESPELFELDYPIHERIVLLQSAILNELFQPDRLARLRDAELKTTAEQVLTMPDLFESLQTAIWQEVLTSQRQLKLSGLRRGVQREYLDALSRMVLRTTNVPEDARTLAWYSLKQLRPALDDCLRQSGKMDTYTRAHLEETRDRIIKLLGAQLQTQ